MPSPLLLETHNLTKTYPGIEPVTAVDHISFSVREGEFLSIVGESGSGKSTLMNLLGLLDSPTEGQLNYHGQDISHWSEGERSLFRNQEIGFIFQAHMLLPEFNALENVLMPPRIGRSLGPETVERAKHLLTRIGLEKRMHHMPGELSGGQNQRVAIARALINNPRIVFADEPTGALDHKTSRDVYELMREINQENNVTFIIVTHEQGFAKKTDRTITLLDGRMISDQVTHPTP